MVIKDKRVQQEIKVPLTELFHCVIWVIFFKEALNFDIFISLFSYTYNWYHLNLEITYYMHTNGNYNYDKLLCNNMSINNYYNSY